MQSVVADLVHCICSKVCRTLLPVTDDFDIEKVAPVVKLVWIHFQVV